MLGKPRRRVERAAAVHWSTALPIPEGVIGVEDVFKLGSFSCRVTEVVTPHPGGNTSVQGGVDAGTLSIKVGVAIGCCEGPDVLSWVHPMCEDHTICIGIIYREIRMKVVLTKRVRYFVLEANDFATDMSELCAIHVKCSG